jgi:hypothetical protein
MKAIYTLIVRIISQILFNAVIVTEVASNTITDGILEVTENVSDNTPRGTALRLQRTIALNAELSTKVKALSAPI